MQSRKNSAALQDGSEQIDKFDDTEFMMSKSSAGKESRLDTSSIE